jgi:multimeric flavodoxin WrbA
VKKILGVVGSPRKNGNTDILVSRILDGAKAAGVAVEKIFLADLKIAECDGCHACWKAERCAKDDDMQALYPKIIGSDLIVFGTPVYWYGPTALMTGFIDRFVYFNCPATRAKIRGKSAVLAIPFEEEEPATADPLKMIFGKSLAYLEMKLLGTILAPGVGGRGDILTKPELLEEAHRLGISLATDV